MTVGDVTPFRRPTDALQASAALFLRTGDPVAREAAAAAWRARYQSQLVSEPYGFAETIPMPLREDSPLEWDGLSSYCNANET